MVSVKSRTRSASPVTQRQQSCNYDSQCPECMVCDPGFNICVQGNVDCVDDSDCPTGETCENCSCAGGGNGGGGNGGSGGSMGRDLAIIGGAAAVGYVAVTQLR